MKNRVEAYILETKSGQWMVDVWSAGASVQCVAGLATEMDAIEEASSLASEYEDMDFVITQGQKPPLEHPLAY